MDCTGVLELEEGTLRPIWEQYGGSKMAPRQPDYTGVLGFCEFISTLNNSVENTKKSTDYTGVLELERGHPKAHLEGKVIKQHSHPFTIQTIIHSPSTWPGGMREAA